MIDVEAFKGIDRDTHCVNFAYIAAAVARMSRYALENETSTGNPEQLQSDVATTLEIVEALMAVVIDGSEDFQRRLKIGLWATRGAGAA